MPSRIKLVPSHRRGTVHGKMFVITGSHCRVYRINWSTVDNTLNFERPIRLEPPLGNKVKTAFETGSVIVDKTWHSGVGPKIVN